MRRITCFIVVHLGIFHQATQAFKTSQEFVTTLPISEQFPECLIFTLTLL